MASRESDPETVIRALPIWNGRIDIQPLLGGITNKNYLVTDAERRAVVRFGGDIFVHGVMRFNELAATRAAGAAGISPKVVYVGPSVLVLDFIAGHSYGPEDARADRDRCVALVKRVHREIAVHLRGPTLAFNVFHIVRDYAHRLIEDRSRMTAQLPRFLAAADALERIVGRSIWFSRITTCSPPISSTTASVFGWSIGITPAGIRPCSILAACLPTMALTRATTSRC